VVVAAVLVSAPAGAAEVVAVAVAVEAAAAAAAAVGEEAVGEEEEEAEEVQILDRPDHHGNIHRECNSTCIRRAKGQDTSPFNGHYVTHPGLQHPPSSSQERSRNVFSLAPRTYTLTDFKLTCATWIALGTAAPLSTSIVCIGAAT
jgi:hypothetical protein